MESKKFNKLCYDELRAVVNLTDKVFITSLFLFAMEDDLKYAKLLYQGYDHIIAEWEQNEIFVELNFENKNVKQAIESITNKLIEKDDANGYYKGLFDGDEYAVAIYEITKTVKEKKCSQLKNI